MKTQSGAAEQDLKQQDLDMVIGAILRHTRRYGRRPKTLYVSPSLGWSLLEELADKRELFDVPTEVVEGLGGVTCATLAWE